MVSTLPSTHTKFVVASTSICLHDAIWKMNRGRRRQGFDALFYLIK